MSQRLRMAPGLALIAAMALAAPALARDLIVTNGPIKAKNVKCRGCVDTRDLGNNAVTSGKLSKDAVTSGKIADGAVGTDEIQDLAVTTGKIADGAVTPDKLAFGIDDNEIAPFRVLTTDGDLCLGTPQIRINNTGSDEFVVTSILVRTSDLGFSDFVTLAIDSVTINGLRFDTPTETLIGPAGAQGVPEATDLMGTPLTVGFFGSREARSGGNFPHQIVASADDDGPEIVVTLSCDFDTGEDFSITGIAVSGWKYTDDSITVSYLVD